MYEQIVASLWKNKLAKTVNPFAAFPGSKAGRAESVWNAE